jgi:hypothetical protein
MGKQIEEMAKVLGEIQEFGINRPRDEERYPVLYPSNKEVADYLISKSYRKASDVAREIFEEIEKEIKLALESNYKAYSERIKKPIVDMADEFIGWVEGKITALRGIEDFISELKKKYESEGEKDNGNDNK